ncbi:hypothetical protein NMG60_11018195 [Bertholletia excelsa]
MEASEQCNNTKRIKQPVSIPFIWEERPGTPKKDWKPTIQKIQPHRPPPPPVKFIASVPFIWEEKPGKPLPCFPQRPLIPPPEKLIDDGRAREDYCEEYKIFEPEFESCCFETDGSFRSAPAARAPPSPPSPAASDSGSSNSSYETGASSLVGAAFLECMFPMLSPEKQGCSEKSASSGEAPVRAQSRKFDSENSCSISVRRPPTLGELIMLSRRRSYIRKAAQVRGHNISMGSMKNEGLGCFMFGFNGKIEELQRKWKRQLQLKLI